MLPIPLLRKWILYDWFQLIILDLKQKAGTTLQAICLVLVTLVIRDMSFFRLFVAFLNRGSARERPKISVTLNALRFPKIAATGILLET